MFERVIEFLFQLAGALVFWSEIFSTVIGMAATIWMSWKLSKVINSGDCIATRKGLQQTIRR